MRFLRKLGIVAAGLVLLALPATVQAQRQDIEEAEATADKSADKEVPVGEWSREGKIGVNLLQSYYTNNWNGGDKGTVVWNATFDYFAISQMTPVWNLAYQFNLAYGQTHEQQRDENGELQWQKPDKTTDQIRFETLLRYTPSAWSPYFSFKFNSMFDDRSDAFGRSATFNPLRFTEALGLSRRLIGQPDRSLLARVGFALNESSRKFYTNPPPDDTTERYGTLDGGVQLVFDYRDKILEDKVEYTSSLTFYRPVFFSGKSDLQDLSGAYLESVGLDADIADYTTTLDIDWDNTFVANITDVVNVQLTVRWVYDKYDNTVSPQLIDDGTELADPTAVATAVRKKGQLKQTMSLGLAYNF